MAIESVDELTDRIRVHLHFSNGAGIADEGYTVEVLYAAVSLLCPSPDFPAGDGSEYWSERVEINSVGETVEFQFHAYQENTSSRMQGLQGGPYLVKKPPKP